MKGHILVIDDEAEIRRNLTVGLAQEDYSATACPDGISAIHELDKAREKGITYDYLVTDIFMPDIDGLKILKVIKNQYPGLPVLVITGYGDISLESEALSEYNTGYLDKPFKISDLIKALEQLAPGSTAKEAEAPKPEADEQSLRESASAYLTIRLTDADRGMDVYREIYQMEGVQCCEAVRGDFDIIILAQASSQDEIKPIFDRIAAVEGVEIVSMSKVERPRLDRGVNEFIKIYSDAVKQPTQTRSSKHPGITSYIIVDIDKEAIQQIFTTVYFIDDVIFCDVIEEGAKLVGMIIGRGAVGHTSHVIEKLREIDGVLRVREAKVINLLEE